MPQAKPSLANAAPLQIFKPGRHTAMSGQALAFSELDLQATVAAYDPAKHEAPLVVGHPQHDLPAYGWVQALQFSEGGIDATPAQVNPDFADMVAAGAFKKISASFYSPDAPANPVPGVYYLRHVGFLGAQAPAVKGMRAPSFADNEEGVLTFAEWDDVDNASLWRSMREWFIGKFGLDEANAVIPSYQVKSLEQGAQDQLRQAQDTSATDLPPAIPSFTEPQQQESTVTETEAAQLRTQMAAQATRIAEMEAAAQAQRVAAVHTAHVAFCEVLPGVPPAFRGVVVATLDHMAAQETALEFGEGEARAPLLDQFKAMLTALPSAVAFGEFATSERAGGATVDFADPQSISDAATAYQKDAAAKGQDLNHAQAVAAVTSKRA